LFEFWLKVFALSFGMGVGTQTNLRPISLAGGGPFRGVFGSVSSFVNEYQLTAPRWPALVSADRNRQRGQRLSVAELRPTTRVRIVLSVEESKRLEPSEPNALLIIRALHQA
jgi:hypothetical protein